MSWVKLILLYSNAILTESCKSKVYFSIFFTTWETREDLSWSFCPFHYPSAGYAVSYLNVPLTALYPDHLPPPSRFFSHSITSSPASGTKPIGWPWATQSVQEANNGKPLSKCQKNYMCLSIQSLTLRDTYTNIFSVEEWKLNYIKVSMKLPCRAMQNTNPVTSLQSPFLKRKKSSIVMIFLKKSARIIFMQ